MRVPRLLHDKRRTLILSLGLIDSQSLVSERGGHAQISEEYRREYGEPSRKAKPLRATRLNCKVLLPPHFPLVPVLAETNILPLHQWKNSRDEPKLFA